MGQARAYLLASLAAFYLITLATPQVTAKMSDYVDIQWGKSKFQSDSNGNEILPLNLYHGETSAFRSKSKYLFGRFDLDIQLVKGNSAGTVTTFYMMSDESWQFHDEIDIEFLGNSSGNPYTMHTNLYVRGKGSREKGYRLPFDPTLDFHTYSIIWNQEFIQILADNKVIRHIKNGMMNGAPYPNYRAMRLYCTIWDADDWATQGGRVKTDWSLAPFTAYFRNFKYTPCSSNQGYNVCGQNSPSAGGATVYDYCSDKKRAIGSPEECKLQ